MTDDWAKKEAWYKAEVRSGIDNFKILKSHDNGAIRYYCTESKTGSQYKVFGVLLDLEPECPMWYVGVLEPVQSSYTFPIEGVLSDDYIAEKIFNRKVADIHPGELTVMTMTIAYMIERVPYIWGQRISDLEF